MVWAGISWRGKTSLVFVDNKFNSKKYVEMLETYLEPFIEEFYPKRATFQQEGAPALTSKHTREYFMEAGIVDMDWAPKSPGMNCIENLWATLSLAVYDGNRQFDTVDDLKECLLYEREKLSQEGIQKLISSIPRSVWELYKKL